MSQQRLSIVIQNMEKLLDAHHQEVLSRISEIRTDFRQHIQDDRKEHDNFRAEHKNIHNRINGMLKYAASISIVSAGLTTAVIWLWNNRDVIKGVVNASYITTQSL